MDTPQEEPPAQSAELNCRHCGAVGRARNHLRLNGGSSYEVSSDLANRSQVIPSGLNVCYDLHCVNFLLCFWMYCWMWWTFRIHDFMYSFINVWFLDYLFSHPSEAHLHVASPVVQDAELWQVLQQARPGWSTPKQIGRLGGGQMGKFETILWYDHSNGSILLPMDPFSILDSHSGRSRTSKLPCPASMFCRSLGAGRDGKKSR